MGGTDLDGRKYLCKNCHLNIHSLIVKEIFNFFPKTMKQQNLLAAWIFKWLPKEQKEQCKNHIKTFTKKYINDFTKTIRTR